MIYDIITTGDVIMLKNKSITEEEKNYYEHHYMDFGTESIIYRSGPNSVIKIWKDKIISDEKKENKKSKIVRIDRKNILYIPKILQTISLDGICIGYETSYDEWNMSMLIAPLDRKDKIKYLKKTKEILAYFYSEGIIYSDVKNDNILINQKTGNISFCDMDNTRVEELPTDLPTYYTRKFVTEYGQEDDKLHSYVHNLFTLAEISGDNPVTVTEGIGLGNYDNLVGEEGKVLLKEMNKITSTYSGKYLIDFVK